MAGTITVRSRLRAAGAIVGALASLLSHPGLCQITPSQANRITSAIVNRVEALTIEGGDLGLTGGSYRIRGSDDDMDMNISKFGGSGEIGEPRRLGDSNVAWQPRVQGSMGIVDADSHSHPTSRNGVGGEFATFAIEFGGGARFWLSDQFSLAPTLMGMYGHTSDNPPAPASSSQTQTGANAKLGWSADTWTVRPALNIQYAITWNRTIFTLSSDATFFHTESAGGSNSNNVEGNAGTLANGVDIDIPLRKQLFGHELRTGGYFSRTELFGDLKDGLDTEHVYEVHGRLVLDFLNQFWKVQWLGVGGSYLWGTNFSGWTVGADVAFRF
ncbi:MAG: Solitary outer membrane autotransporter beta-barrel domain [Burkholderiaceae bacterium]|nr:Solitary outer membrane autotransporter beta-barrel domain [Burkholderiaceae bacterium]